MNRFVLMRKNEPVCAVSLTDDGKLKRYSAEGLNENLAPLGYRTEEDWLGTWWANRASDENIGNLGNRLKAKGYAGTAHYLMNNLGLSLQDYYWLRPVFSTMTWEEVNFFGEDFGKRTPNASLQGTSEAVWQIHDGKKFLVKVGSGNTSAEGLNEVLACYLHRKQGYDNCVEYMLIKVKDRDNAFGCCCGLVTDETKEMISAKEIVTSEERPEGVSLYEHFIAVCGKHGMDVDQLRKDLEYMILTDYVLANNHRSLDNVSILRDAQTLQFLRLAPIYSGSKGLFAHIDAPKGDALFDMDAEGFAAKESQLLALVTDFTLVDPEKLPSSAEITKLYSKDPGMTSIHTAEITEAYEKRLAYFKEYIKK